MGPEGQEGTGPGFPGELGAAGILRPASLSRLMDCGGGGGGGEREDQRWGEGCEAGQGGF